MKTFRFVVTLLFVLNVLPVFAADTIQLDTIVITPSRIAQNGYKISSNVSVIDTKQIEASNAKTVVDVLEKELGVHIYDNGTPKTAIIDIRGFGDTASRNVLVLVNDRKINSIDITGPDTLQIPLEAVQKIEIIRGAGSVLYGDNAVGGVINIITKEGKGDLSGKVGQIYGSYQTTGTDLEVSGAKKFKWSGLDNDVSYFIYSKYYDTVGYRVNSDLTSEDYNARLGYKLSDKISVSLDSGWHEDNYGLPGGLSFTELETLGRRGSADPDDFASSKDRFVQLGFDVKPWPKDIDFGHFVLDFSYRNRDTYASFAAFDFNTRRNIDSYGLNGKYIFDKTLFGQDFNFVTGFDISETSNHILGSGTNTDELTISKDELGMYVFGEYEALENLFVNLGSRFHEANYVFDQKAATASYTSDTPRESVNTVGAKYEYGQGSNIFFDVQQTFRFLATDEWYDSFSGVLNTDLKQQTGLQYEAGVKHNLNNMTLVSITPYWMDLKNEIFFNPTAGFFGSNDNYEKTRRRGIEIGQKTDLLRIFPVERLKRLEVFTNYSLQDPRFLKGANDDKLIPMAPQHQANFGFNAGVGRVNASFVGHYVGESFAINDTQNATPPIKPYFTLDGKLSYDAKNFEFFAALNNMLDEKYYTYIVKSAGSNAKDHFPAPGRNFVLGTKVKF